LADHTFLGPPFRRFGARHVDLLGLLGDLREHRDTVRQDLGEAERNRQVVPLLADAIPQLADLQRASSGV
jgi:hypothetical protein